MTKRPSTEKQLAHALFYQQDVDEVWCVNQEYDKEKLREELNQLKCKHGQFAPNRLVAAIHSVIQRGLS